MSTQTIKKNIIVGTDSQIQARSATDPTGTIYLSTSEPVYPVTDVKTSTNGTVYTTVLDGSVAKIDLSPYLTSHQTMLYRPVNMNGSEIISNTASTAVNFAAGTNISLTNTPGTGTITISNTASAPALATSSTEGLVKLGSDTVQTEAAQAVSSTADRSYAVQVNSSGQMVVNVPWTGGGGGYLHNIVVSNTGTQTHYFSLIFIDDVPDYTEFFSLNTIPASTSKLYQLCDKLGIIIETTPGSNLSKLSPISRLGSGSEGVHALYLRPTHGLYDVAIQFGGDGSVNASGNVNMTQAANVVVKDYVVAL